MHPANVVYGIEGYERSYASHEIDHITLTLSHSDHDNSASSAMVEMIKMATVSPGEGRSGRGGLESTAR